MLSTLVLGIQKACIQVLPASFRDWGPSMTRRRDTMESKLAIFNCTVGLPARHGHGNRLDPSIGLVGVFQIAAPRAFSKAPPQ